MLRKIPNEQWVKTEKNNGLEKKLKCGNHKNQKGGEWQAFHFQNFNFFISEENRIKERKKCTYQKLKHVIYLFNAIWLSVSIEYAYCTLCISVWMTWSIYTVLYT